MTVSQIDPILARRGRENVLQVDVHLHGAVHEVERRLHSGEELYSRDNAAAHLTVSAWVVSPDRSQVLMAYHKLYDSWAWLGGHADGDRDLLVWFAGAALVLLAAEWLLHAKENSV